MTREEKDLLLKDLCARLPYGVKFQSENIETALFVDTSDDEVWINGTCIDDFKPFLFPLSSMTEEQKKEYKDLLDNQYSFDANGNIFTLQDFYYKYHLDFRGLIPMGLAIDATGLNIY